MLLSLVPRLHGRMLEKTENYKTIVVLLFFRLLLRVEEHRTRHQNGMGKRETLSLIYDKCMQPGSLNRDNLMH